jgi:hypothetical protein
MLRDLIRNVLVVGFFLGGSGFILTEMILALFLPLVSVRALVFILVTLVCWFLMDSITLAHDLERATASTSTDGERHLLRSLSYTSRKCELVQSFLKHEIAEHANTARKLDQELASKASVTYISRKLDGCKKVLIMSRSLD